MGLALSSLKMLPKDSLRVSTLSQTISTKQSSLCNITWWSFAQYTISVATPNDLPMPLKKIWILKEIRVKIRAPWPIGLRLRRRGRALVVVSMESLVSKSRHLKTKFSRKVSVCYRKTCSVLMSLTESRTSSWKWWKTFWSNRRRKWLTYKLPRSPRWLCSSTKLLI